MAEKEDVLAGRVHVALPVSRAEVIEGISDEVEGLAGEAGLLISPQLEAERRRRSSEPRIRTSKVARSQPASWRGCYLRLHARRASAWSKLARL